MKDKIPKAWHVYLLRCSDGSYYTGTTTNLIRRLNQHQKGKGAKYTRSRLPVEMVWHTFLNASYFPNRSSAQIAEHKIRSLSHNDKHQLALFAEFLREWGKTAKVDPKRKLEDVYKAFYESKGEPTDET